jgi:hypothetical protein
MWATDGGNTRVENLESPPCRGPVPRRRLLEDDRIILDPSIKRLDGGVNRTCAGGAGARS